MFKEQNGHELQRLIPTEDTIRSELQKFEKSLQQASSTSQLLKLLSQIESKQQQLEDVLHIFTSRKLVSHHSLTRSLEFTRVELSSTLNHSRSLKRIMEDASYLSSKITEKVRLLDSEKSKIKTTKEYVENVKVLKNQVQKANDSISHEDWLSASQSICKIRELPQGLITDEFVEFIVPTSEIPDMPQQLLTSWIDQLTRIFIEEFNLAAKNKDVERLTYFFQLFPLIGKSEEGLTCYSRFICDIISEQSRAILRNIQGKADVRSDFYAQILFQLYQTIAEIVRQHSPIIKKFYGSTVITKIMAAIQTECDLQSGLIFDTFWDSRKLERAFSDVSRYSYPVLVRSIYNTPNNDDEEIQEDESVVSLAEVSNLIDELSTMLNHWSMYCKFFVVTWNDAIQCTDKSEAVYPKPLLTSTFMAKIRTKVTRNFDQLCTFAIRRTIEKASLIENSPDLLPQLSLCVKYLAMVSKSGSNSNPGLSLSSLSPEDPPVSSMIEDITMSLNLIMLQTLTTGEFLTIKNMVSNTRRIVENDFLSMMKKKFADFQPKPNSLLLTQQTIQFLQAPQHKNFYSSVTSQNGSSTNLNKVSPRSETPPIGSTDKTGNMFMKSATSAINAAINMNGSESESAEKLSNFVVTLNSISVFQRYLSKLSDNMIQKLVGDNLLVVDDQEFNQVLTSFEKDTSTNIELTVNLVDSQGSDDVPSVQDRIKTVISTLSSTFKTKSDLLLQDQINILFQQVFKFKTTRLINDTFKDGDYLLSPDNNSINSSSDSILQFIKEWNSSILPYLTTLTKENFNTLIELIVSHISQILEVKIWSMERKCNELGATKLEKDISTVIAETTKFDYRLRNKFIRITQIVMTLGLDDDEKIEDLNDLEWTLTPLERDRARNLRVDRK